MKFVVALLNADEMKRGMAGHFPPLGTQYPHGLFWPKRKPQALAINATYTVTYRPYTRVFSVAVGG
jgi:hypothetical protein